LKNADSLAIGQRLDIPPVSGTVHIVKDGETAGDIASKYAVDLQAIMAFEGNHLSNPDVLSPGTKLVIPGGVKPQDPPKLMVASVVPPPPAPARAPVPVAVAAPPPPPPPPPRPPVQTKSGLMLQWPASGPPS